MERPKPPGYAVLKDRRLLDLLTKEAQRHCKNSIQDARRKVLSAIGEPKTLEAVDDALAQGKVGLAKAITRRRLIDSFRKDARPDGWRSLEGEEAATNNSNRYQPDAGRQLDCGQMAVALRKALACFANKGEAQRRQATLLQRFDLDEVNYAKLCSEMGCSRGALRVRVHMARSAFGKHIIRCHPELSRML